MSSTKEKPSPPISRTQKKRVAKERQQLGERLVALPEEQLGGIPMPAELAEAVADARKMRKHGARRRQLQRIGALMRQLDPTPIERALARLAQGDREAVRRFREVERWRDALLAGEGRAMADIRQRCPSVDDARLAGLVAAYQRAQAVPAKRKAARNLFRYLRDAIAAD
ncbi:MAG: ribosome biogenesis factor YjgA [Desulfosarcinaceae bacterium]|nr:ribosome biogenesis factor YjgA [Desulfosarcinaceae bacterium]